MAKLKHILSDADNELTLKWSLELTSGGNLLLTATTSDGQTKKHVIGITTAGMFWRVGCADGIGLSTNPESGRILEVADK